MEGRTFDRDSTIRAALIAHCGDESPLLHLLWDVLDKTVAEFMAKPTQAEYQRKCTVVSRNYDAYKDFYDACTATLSKGHTERPEGLTVTGYFADNE